MLKKKKTEPLIGEKLLYKVKELGNLSKEEKAKTCGYYSVTKSGIERVNMMQFLNALIDAEGIELDGTSRNKKHKEPRASGQIAIRSIGVTDSNEIIAIKRANKAVAKPEPSSQPVPQTEIEPVQQLEIEQLEQPAPVVCLKSLVEPTRKESVFGSGWSMAELMNEFSGRYSG